MKKLLALLLSLAMALSLAACGGGETAQQEPGGDAAGETYSFSVGTNTAEDSVNHLLAAKFKELIEDRSDGAVTVTLYENGALGGDAELTESCIAGSVDFIVGMTGSLVNYIPEAALFDLPNVFPDLETAREVLDGPILAELQAAYEAGGLKLFGYADSGFRVMTSSKAVRQMSDFSGIKIRTMENPNHIAYWQALGANPTPADFSELYMSLEQGTLDAQENPYDLIVANKLYEPQAYVIETNHLLHTLNMVGSKATYDALPADIQQLVSECAAEAHQYARQMADERIEGQKSTIQDAGLEIITLEPAMIQEMADVSANVYDLVREQIGTDLVDSLLAQVDSSVGGKTAIDLTGGKNLVGAFKQPVAVLCDLDTLHTLPKLFLADGMGEVIKYGMIRDEKLFTLLEQHTLETVSEVMDEIVPTCIDIKRDVVEQDPTEQGERALLNFGHTLGHAYEKAYHYETYTHGEAVAAGMVKMLELERRKGRPVAALQARLERVLKAFQLPIEIPCTMEDYRAAVGLDKKAQGRCIGVIEVVQPGQAEIVPMEKEALFALLEEKDA